MALNLKSAREVAEAFTRLIRSEEQALIQRMAPSGVEVIIGAYRDPHFGPVVMFGAGGVDVETLEDVAFRLPPLTRAEAQAMLEETTIGRRLLQRYREGSPEAIEALVDIMQRVGWMMLEHPEIGEIDLNPVIVAHSGESVLAVDVRVVLSEGAPAPVEAALPL